MPAPTSLRRFLLTATAVALAGLWQAAVAETAFATCGDWLDHSAASQMRFDDARQPAAPPVPRCHGPQCRGTPLSFPWREPRRITSGQDLRAALVALRHVGLMFSRRLEITDDLRPHVVYRGRLDRPPRDV
jgi:hypothetical protein